MGGDGEAEPVTKPGSSLALAPTPQSPPLRGGEAHPHSALMDRPLSITPAITRRLDYRPPDWLVDTVHLTFTLDAERTVVTARLALRRNGTHDRPLVLDGEELETLSVTLDGTPAEPAIAPTTLTLAIPGDAAELATTVAIRPSANTRLMGLYESGGLLCTQCEAEGFRRIVWFPDRPDVLAVYTVRLEADADRYPVLLSNGEPIAEGPGRAEWHDPWPKPSYLFALVAGDLVASRSAFTTASDREVQLAVWTRAGDEGRTGHALQALGDAMAWDERAYGREYDGDRFNIVAVDDFNFGAMENKGLNIFNSRYVLADDEIATDADRDAIARIVAHEYFHNWSGNRVTCRDWFQLSLKEGFTVLRDQGFSEDHGSAGLERVRQVRALRAHQFPEDAGPLRHPIRPDDYAEISNFYTATVYDKGAEVLRMLRTLIGPETFRRGSDLYFERHDGTAATCEDFLTAMIDAARGADGSLPPGVAEFGRWYSTPGTPTLAADLAWDAEARAATLTLRQSLPDGAGPLPLPVRARLFDRQSGEPMGEERTLALTDAGASVRWDGVDRPPALSLNRGFSAPVLVERAVDRAEWALLAARDDDPFARFEALNELMLDDLVARAAGTPHGDALLADAVARVIAGADADPAFSAETLAIPAESILADRMLVVEPDAVVRARQTLAADLGRALAPQWRSLEAAAARHDHPGWRALRALAIAMLTANDEAEGAALAWALFDGAGGMTDRRNALAVLADTASFERGQALAAFHERHRDQPTALDKWFAAQGSARRPDTRGEVERLLGHPDFTRANPNRMRALLSTFAANLGALHSAGGVELLAREIVAVDRLNPQAAARLVAPLGQWRRFAQDEGRRMRMALEGVASTPGLSKDVAEQVGRSLG